MEQLKLSDEQFKQLKQNSLKLYAYTNRVMAKARDIQMQQTMGYALFDKSGYLLKLYGPDSFLLWCDSIGLEKGTLWDSASFCESAVSEGLNSLHGEWFTDPASPSPMLSKLSMYFHPLVLDSKTDTTTIPELYGGIAVIAPCGELNTESALICTALADDITLHMFMAKELYDLYFNEPKGLLNIDINVRTGVPHILYHNELLFSILGIPYENLYFKKADTFFDPRPANKELWDIIEQVKIIDEQLIPLTIRGKTENYLVSTAAYKQLPLEIQGVRFFITTPKEVSRSVAKRVGNNAVYSFSGIIGQSPKMQRAIRQAELLAQSDSNIMITGESGVGKDLFAQAIHNASRRRDNPFIVLNCAAIPRDLLASELFGYDQGAYTGAKKNGNLGKFELADTGTIFLDEIGDMPLDLQVMLLRVIEQKSFMRIGSNITRNVDVKIISATNADLKSMVEKKTFRPDLYFRLCTLSLRLPPLRERADDIILLSEYFIERISARLKQHSIKHLSDETKALLMRLPWNGNVRELQNVMERVVQLIPSQIITPQDLSICMDYPIDAALIDEVERTSGSHVLTRPFIAVDTDIASDGSVRAVHDEADAADTNTAEDYSPTQISEVKKTKNKTSGKNSISEADIINALEHTHYNRTMAANYLGVSRKTFYRKLEELNIRL